MFGNRSVRSERHAVKETENWAGGPEGRFRARILLQFVLHMQRSFYFNELNSCQFPVCNAPAFYYVNWRQLLHRKPGHGLAVAFAGPPFGMEYEDITRLL